MSEEKLLVSVMFPSKYLCAEDFRGMSVEKTISGIEPISLRMKNGTKEDKYVIRFQDTKKMLVLNVTNARSIADVLNERDALKWIGHKITLFPTTCEAFGKTVDCIRVKGGE